MGQPFDVLGQPVGIEPLDGRHDLTMESAPPILEQTPVGHIVGEGMLEGVLKIGKEPRLIKELGGLKLGQASA